MPRLNSRPRLPENQILPNSRGRGIMSSMRRRRSTRLRRSRNPDFGPVFEHEFVRGGGRVELYDDGEVVIQDAFDNVQDNYYVAKSDFHAFMKLVVDAPFPQWHHYTREMVSDDITLSRQARTKRTRKPVKALNPRRAGSHNMKRSQSARDRAYARLQGYTEDEMESEMMDFSDEGDPTLPETKRAVACRAKLYHPHHKLYKAPRKARTMKKRSKKLTRKQKSRLNKAAFRAKRKTSTARKSAKRTTKRKSTARRSVKRSSTGRFVRKGSKARKTTKRRATKRKSVRARYRTGSMGERIRTNPRRRSASRRRNCGRNPGSQMHFGDGGMASYFKVGRKIHVTISTAYGENHEYETTAAGLRKLTRAKTTSAARRAMSGATLRHINPGRRIVRGRRLTGGRIKRTAKGRFARR